ncbi:MAG: NAD(P)H-dependent oxidoreductase, partial [Campylobacterota bacterium]|nr:NAD(P)H-dependent oxidoreductase [Campylobacterota bacterium]
ACKLFDENKKIEPKDLEFILESGRLSPSSFGMEHWRFIVIQSDELKAKMRPLCWNQPQITSCSDLVVVVSKTQEVAKQPYYAKMLGRRGLPQEKLDGYLDLYSNFTTALPSLEAWSSKQCYIASTNMMNYASLIGIDSCPIEGFEKEPLEELLEINEGEDIALLIPFGYRVNPQSEKLRLELDEIVEYR